MKNFLKRALEDSRPDNRLFYIISDFLAFLTLFSIAVVVIETLPSLENYKPLFLVLEWIMVFFFSLEYLGRLIVTPKKIAYIFSLLGLVDLLAILPTFLGLGNLTFLKSARTVRIIRLLRMMRLVKMSRLPKGTDPEKAPGIFAINILIYGVLLLLSLVVTGAVIYVAGVDTTITSIPAGMLWSLKIFMSVGVAEPATGWGLTIYIFTKFVGYLLLGLLIGVAGNILQEFLFGSKKEKGKSAKKEK